jgi:hypothetical protein
VGCIGVFVGAARRIARTDQIGRVVAVFVVSPVLAYKGVVYDDAFIRAFSVVLFAWDLWWLVARPPRRT